MGYDKNNFKFGKRSKQKISGEKLNKRIYKCRFQFKSSIKFREVNT